MQKLIEFAQEIAEARKHEIPSKLVKLKDIISYNTDLEKLKHEIYKLDLLEALSAAFKYDYGYIKDGWDLAVDLVKIFGQCTYNLIINEKHYQNEILPQALENTLILAKKIQDKHNKNKTEFDELARLFKITLQEHSKIINNHSYLAEKSFNSQRLFQLLLNDDQKTSSIVIDTYNEILKAKKILLKKLPENVLYSFLDEIIYKLATCELIDAGFSIFQLLVTMCRIDPYLIKLITRRYKGIKSFVSKWGFRNIGNEYNEFKEMFEDAEKSKMTDQFMYDQALVIQKVWRGYKARKSLKEKMSKVTTLQKAYRNRLAKKETDKAKKMADDELRFQLLILHRRKQRQKQVQLAELIEILPANKIDWFMEKQREDAAKRIQALWRGYQVRKNFQKSKQKMIRIRAVVKIQTAVRKWLERLRQKRQRPAIYSRPRGLDSHKKEFLIDKIRKHVENLPPHPRTEKTTQDLHDKSQRMFQDYVLKQQEIRQQQQKLELLMITANNDADLILNAPKLSDVNEDDIINYYTHKSKPVQLAAKRENKHMLWKNSAKWYELLKDDSESESEFDDIDYMRERFEELNFSNNKNNKMANKGIPIRERVKLKTTNLRQFANQLNTLKQMLEN
ncbi:unnamed protein product [Brachionus calyciflorus]|uniref:IQ calmodulin-binding motif family protein n=1 Tax=Brachionus calyciflorus TaxID=104777 RepID=A0A813N8X9_9BILA|nr:unnamed protein product [Brachionus calyciflorus]